MKILIDATIGTKWFIPEDYSINVLKLLEDYISGNIELYALDMFKIQVADLLKRYLL